MSKKESLKALTITNPKILEFFRKHSSIDHQEFILFFIEHIEKMFDTMTGDLNKSIITNTLDQLQQSFLSLSLRVAESKREFTDDVKMIVSANNSEKLEPLIREQTTLSFEKTSNLLSQKINSNDGSVSKALTDTENKFTATISSTENRLDSKITEVRQNCETIKSLISNNTSDTSSLNDSSEKGKISENILVNILQPLYPCSQIDHVGHQKETGDAILIRKNKPKILIENKNWNRNVTQEEVKKFIHDSECQNCCGLFLSQNCGIANKDNFEINVHDGNVLLYVHNVNNDPEKIKIAIDIIDYFKAQLDDLENTSETDSIPKEKLEAINGEFQAFVQSKLSLIKLAKDFHQKFTKQIDELKIPTLEEYLSTKYATIANKVTCEYCQRGFKNKASLASHLKGCSEKKAMKTNGPVITIN